MDSIVFREYRFVRFGHIVRQLFSHSPRHVYVIDYLVKGSWQKSTIHTYESMVSSMRFVPATTPREGRATP